MPDPRRLLLLLLSVAPAAVASAQTDDKEVSVIAVDRWIERRLDARLPAEERRMPPEFISRAGRVSARLEKRFLDESGSLVPGRHDRLVELVRAAGELKAYGVGALDWVVGAADHVRNEHGERVAETSAARLLERSAVVLEREAVATIMHTGADGIERMFAVATDPAVPVAVRFQFEKTLLSIDPHRVTRLGPASKFDALFVYADRADGLLLDWLGTVLGTFGQHFIDDVIERLEISRSLRRIRILRLCTGFEEQALRLRSPLRKVYAEGDEVERYWAIHAASAFAPDTLAMLVEALSDEDGMIRACAAEGIERSISQTDEVPREEREQLGGQFLYLGARFEREAIAFRYLERNAVSVLQKGLSDPVERVRVFCALTLYKLGHFAATAHDELARVAESDRSELVRYWSARAAGRMENQVHAQLDRYRRRLIKLGEIPESLDEVTLDQRIADLRMDVELPPDQVEREGDAWVEIATLRWRAARSLILDGLPELLDRSDEGLLRATEVLEALASELDYQIGAMLHELLTKSREELASGSTGLLTELGPVMIDELQRLYIDVHARRKEESEERERVTVLLQGLGERSLPVWVEGLEHWGSMRPESAHGIRSLGPDGFPALPVVLAGWRWRGDDIERANLVRFWTHRVPKVRMDRSGREYVLANNFDAVVLSRMGRRSLTHLLNALGDRHEIVRARVCSTLGNMPQFAEEIEQPLAGRLQDSSFFVRRAAARALLILGGNERPREKAAQVLEELGES